MIDARGISLPGGPQELLSPLAADSESFLDTHDFDARVRRCPVESYGLRREEMHMATERVADIGACLRQDQRYGRAVRLKNRSR
jgi:hypothetical protein